MDLAELERDGYQIVRSALAPSDVAATLREVERLKTLVLASQAADDPRLRVLWSKSRFGGRTLRGLQNAHCLSPMLDAIRLHRGIAPILLAALGPDTKTVLTSIFWKSPGEAETGIAYHQDAWFRQPASAYRNLARSYLQLQIALDPQDDDNGGLRFVPGSHRQARMFPRPRESVLTGEAAEPELSAMGLASSRVETVRLEPGDVAIWNAFTVHGSQPNRSSDRDRRAFSIAWMRAGDCDAGIDAYVGGRAIPATTAPVS